MQKQIRLDTKVLAGIALPSDIRELPLPVVPVSQRVEPMRASITEDDGFVELSEIGDPRPVRASWPPARVLLTLREIALSQALSDQYVRHRARRGVWYSISLAT